MIGSERFAMPAPALTARGAVSLAAVPALSVLLCALLVRLARVATAVGIVLPAMVGFLVAMLLLLRLARTLEADRASTVAAAVQEAAQTAAEQAAEQAGEVDRAGSRLRHDLRGILSPALLTADRLAMSQDPVARRAGEAMISTVERAEARLARPA